MGYKQFFMPLFAAIFLFTSTGSAQEPESVAILIKGESEFDVFYSRALSNSVGAAIGGLIGAGIQAAAESSRDSELRESMVPRVEPGHWREHFLDVLNERLDDKDIAAHWVEDGEEVQADVVLQLELDTHGFRVIDNNTRLMAAFVEFDYRLFPAGLSRRDVPDFQPLYVTSKTSRAREGLLEDDVVLNEDLNEALSKAARRMANRIIYWNP